MKRRAVKLFVFLLVGAIINVAVAWGVSLRLENSNLTELSDEESIRLWNQFALPTWSSPPACIGQADQTFAGASILMAWGVSTLDIEYDETGFAVLSYGLPLQSLRRVVWMENSKGIHGGRLLVGERQLPIDVLWPAFAINTIFYAAIVWFLFFAPGAVRRRVRRKRGQCAACGYSLRGTPDVEKCPECGALTNRSP